MLSMYRATSTLPKVCRQVSVHMHALGTYDPRPHVISTYLGTFGLSVRLTRSRLVSPPPTF